MGFVYVNYCYVNLIMFNKALFWIFVWFLKTWKKSSPLSEIYIFLCNLRYTRWFSDWPIQVSIQFLPDFSLFNNALASIDQFGCSSCVSTTADAAKQAIRGSSVYIEDNLRYYGTFNDVDN